MEKEEQDVSQNMRKVLYGNRDAKIVTGIKNLIFERNILTAAIRLQGYVNKICIYVFLMLQFRFVP